MSARLSIKPFCRKICSTVKSSFACRLFYFPVLWGVFVFWGLSVFVASGFLISGVWAQGIIAAASSLNQVLPRLNQAYEDQGYPPFRLVYGASGLLARRIEAGAPYDILLSARMEDIDWLSERNHLAAPARHFTTGSLSLYIDPQLSTKNVTVTDILSAWFLNRKGPVPPRQRLAIANPRHAPYGRVAKDVLLKSGIWPERPAHFFVMGDSAAQAARYVFSGEVRAGLLPTAFQHLSPPEIRRFPLPVSIPYFAARIARPASQSDPEEIEAFIAFLQSKKAQTILHQAGFSQIDEAEGQAQSDSRKD